ncbi:MAG: bifunctional methylenetetrahydrofolate dehydrogenase/methenyltetrahydrofolate cyclohydrolase FolD [Candidatus Poseidoniaceae archaeon]
MMTAQILDGKACASQIEKEIIAEVSKISRPPHLVVVIVGDDPASKVYVGNKIKTCKRLGIRSTLIEKKADISESLLVSLIQELNDDDDVDGILIQSPLPNHLDEMMLTDLIDPNKDVDGFHPINLGRLVQGRTDGLIPCTPHGIIRLLNHYQIPLQGKQAVVIGRSRIVGMPMSLLLASQGCNATVTITHSKTEDLAEVVKKADIVIAAVGRAEMIDDTWIKPGCVVVDVGINRVDDASHERGWKLSGDAHLNVSTKASWVSPVPGGVGPMTVMMLMQNTVNAAKNRRQK